jgi:DNA-binding CsgD family transcriptional regulator
MTYRPSKTEEMVQLVGLVHAAAAEPAKARELLCRTAATLSATTAHLFLRDVATGVVSHSYMGDGFEDANRRYARDWGPSDPRAQWLATRPAGQVLRCDEHFDKGFIDTNRFFRDFLVPHGLRWSLAAKFPSAPGVESVIAVMRAPEQPPVEAAAVTMLQQLLPHFQQAAAVRLRLERQAAAVHAATEMLRMLPSPCLFTDQAGRYLEANEAFSRDMGRMSLRLATGRVRFTHTQLQAQWESALFQVHSTALASKMSFTDPAHQEWTAHLVPWLPLVGQTDAVDKRMILVVFREGGGEQRPHLQPGSMASAARLTRAEAEVLGGLLKGLPAKAIATRRSASVNTVRSQIVAILEKTGFRSQKELMASFSASVLPESAFSNSRFDDASQATRSPPAWPSSSSGRRP